MPDNPDRCDLCGDAFQQGDDAFVVAHGTVVGEDRDWEPAADFDGRDFLCRGCMDGGGNATGTTPPPDEPRPVAGAGGLVEVPPSGAPIHSAWIEEIEVEELDADPQHGIGQMDPGEIVSVQGEPQVLVRLAIATTPGGDVVRLPSGISVRNSGAQEIDLTELPKRGSYHNTGNVSGNDPADEYLNTVQFRSGSPAGSFHTNCRSAMDMERDKAKYLREQQRHVSFDVDLAATTKRTQESLERLKERMAELARKQAEPHDGGDDDA